MQRQQTGQIIKISGRWFVRYWEKRCIDGTIQRKRVTHELGPVTARAKYPPADIKDASKEFMATINKPAIPAEHLLTMGDFVTQVYLPHVAKFRRPSTLKSYSLLWKNHLAPRCQSKLLRDVKTCDVQNWLNEIGKDGLAKNTLTHCKWLFAAIFKYALQQDCFPERQNPARGTAIDPNAPEAEETHAYTPEEMSIILACLPEPEATIFATACYTGLRHGELMGLEWPDFHDGALHVERNIWDGKPGKCKTRKSMAAVPVIKPLADMLEAHRKRDHNPQSGPIFRNGRGNRLSLASVADRRIWPALNVCKTCSRPQRDHVQADHEYERNEAIPQWRGWHACRRGLGTNLHHLKVQDKVIQRVLRHSDVNTTLRYYVKPLEPDVREGMNRLEDSLRDTNGTLNAETSSPKAVIQ